MKKRPLTIFILLFFTLYGNTGYAAFPVKWMDTTTELSPKMVNKVNTGIADAVAEVHVHRSVLSKLITHVSDRYHHYRSQVQKYRNMAILFCIVCLGLHRLYMGYTITGIMQLIAEVLGIAAIFTFAFFGHTLVLSYALYYVAAVFLWQMWDLFRLLTGKMNPKNGYFVNDLKHIRRRNNRVRDGF